MDKQYFDLAFRTINEKVDGLKTDSTARFNKLEEKFEVHLKESQIIRDQVRDNTKFRKSASWFIRGLSTIVMGVVAKMVWWK